MSNQDQDSADIIVVPKAGSALKLPVNASEVFAKIRECHAQAKAAVQNANWNAYIAGRLLLDLKHEMRSAGEDGFMAAVKRELPHIQYSTARNYMDFARKAGQAIPDLRTQSYTEQAPALLAQMAGGKSLTQLYMDLGVVKRPGNMDAETGKRLHHPAKVSSAERAEDAVTKRAANMARAIDTLQVEVDHGNFDAFTDEEAEIRYAQLQAIVERIRTLVIGPRAAAKAGKASKLTRSL